MKTNATERQALARRIFKQIEDKVVGYNKDLTSGKLKTPTSLQKLVKKKDSLTQELSEVTQNLKEGIAEHNKWKPTSHFGLAIDSEYVQGIWTEALRYTLNGSWGIKDEIEDEITLMQMDSDNAKDLMERLSKVFDVKI